MSVQDLLGDKSFVYAVRDHFSLSNVILIADELRLHNDLQVTKKESQVILYWNNNLTKEETEKYSVKYILSYTFFDTFQERKVSCSMVTCSLSEITHYFIWWMNLHNLPFSHCYCLS